MGGFIKTAAIISTGDELVGGRTVDTNASYIADRLAGAGVEVVSITTVGDDVERMNWAWQGALEQADLVVSTGGLGPTIDDLTNETVATVAGVELVMNEVEAERIREMFTRRGRPMPENNLKQAMIPAGAEVIANELGTAPGYRLTMTGGRRRPVAVALPGVPREMKPMLDEQVIPWVLGRTEPDVTVVAKTFQTFGLPESALDEMLSGAVPPDQGRLAFRASFPKIAVRIAVTGSMPEAGQRLERLAAEVRDRLGAAVYAEGEAGLEDVVGEMLRKSGKTLATAESCTGGLIGSRITDVAGSSDYYMGGLVAYSNDLKQQGLGVATATLDEHGAVSEETAREMALGICRMTGADIGVATTGIAGPGGGTDEKPVGTVAIALATRHRDVSDGWSACARMYLLWGSREWIKVLTSQVALDWIRRELLGLDPLGSDFSARDRTGERRGAGG